MSNRNLIPIISAVYLALQIGMIIAYYHPPLNAAEVTKTAVEWMPWIAGIDKDIGENNKGGIAMKFVLAVAHLPMLLFGFISGLAATTLGDEPLGNVSPIKMKFSIVTSVISIIAITVLTYWFITLSGPLKMSRPILAGMAPAMMGLLVWNVLHLSKKLIGGK